VQQRQQQQQQHAASRHHSSTGKQRCKAAAASSSSSSRQRQSDDCVCVTEKRAFHIVILNQIFCLIYLVDPFGSRSTTSTGSPTHGGKNEKHVTCDQKRFFRVLFFVEFSTRKPECCCVSDSQPQLVGAGCVDWRQSARLGKFMSLKFEGLTCVHSVILFCSLVVATKAGTGPPYSLEDTCSANSNRKIATKNGNAP
jgi:hypothetical protein